MKMIARARTMGGAGELAERLAHQTRLEPHVRSPHVSFELRLWNERGDGVDDDEIDGAALHEDLRDVERLLAAVRLAHEKLRRADAEVSRVVDVERVLGVDERRDAARGLAFCNRVQGEGGLPARLGAVDFDDATLGIAAAAERLIERGTPGRNARHALGFSIAEPHHGALSKLLLDALEHAVDGFDRLLHRVRFSSALCCG